VGGTTATIGFTGATGGLNANQTITNFQFTPGNAVSHPATITPIAVTGWNQNMIISATNGSANITATMDGGTAKNGDAFYELGANNGTTNPTNPATASGVPKAGVTFGSSNDINHAFQLQPNGPGQNDAVMLDSGSTSGTLTLNTPARYLALSFLVAGANGGGSINATVNYQGGGTQSTTISAPDWFNGGPVAWYAAGRVDTNLDDFNNVLNNNPRMYQEDLTLTDTTDPVLSVSFSFGGSNREVVYGISGTAVPVPEPSTFVLVGLGALGMYGRRRRIART
jgi:hypothetical protein